MAARRRVAKETIDTVVLLGCALSCVVVALVLVSEGDLARPLLPRVSARHLSIAMLVLNMAATLYFLLW